MSKRKLLIAKIVVSLLVVLLFCTFISKNIYTLMLPKVQLYTLKSGALTDSATTTGNYSYVKTEEIKSKGNFIVSDVLVQNNMNVNKGDVLFKVDTSSNEIDTARLELAVMQLNNQLNPDTAKSDSEHEELVMQLNIAQKELDLYNQQFPHDNEQQQASLEQAILDAKAQVKLSNDMYDYQSLLLQLRGAQNALSAYRHSEPDPDPGQLDELELQVDNCQHQVDVYLASNYQNNALKARLKIAEDELEAFKETEDEKYCIEKGRLELQVLKLKNQLEGKAQISDKQKNELQKQLTIAQRELLIQRDSFPVKGEIIAPIDGIVTNFTLKQGETLNYGDVCANMVPVGCKNCVEFNLNYPDGSQYNVGDDVILNVMTEESKVCKQIVTNISYKKLDVKTNTYDMKAEYEPPEGFIKDVQPTVRLIKSSEQYEILVPLSCLVLTEPGKYSLNILETRKGIFSDETVIRQVAVEVENKNSLYAAVKSNELHTFGMQVVQYTSKPITKGSVVKVVN